MVTLETFETALIGTDDRWDVTEFVRQFGLFINTDGETHGNQAELDQSLFADTGW